MKKSEILYLEAATVLLGAAIETGTTVVLPPFDLALLGQIGTALRGSGAGKTQDPRRWVFPSVRLAEEFVRDPPLPSMAVGGETGAFFPTPTPIGQWLCDRAGVEFLPPGSRVLEPSAGVGHLIRAILLTNPAVAVDWCEFDGSRAAYLRARRWYAEVAGIAGDFLAQPIAAQYAAVVLNPPFSTLQQKNVFLAHVRHAFSATAPGGRCVALIPPTWRTGSTKAFLEFRRWLDPLRYEWEPIPEELGADWEYTRGNGTLILYNDQSPAPPPDRPEAVMRFLTAGLPDQNLLPGPEVAPFDPAEARAALAAKLGRADDARLPPGEVARAGFSLYPYRACAPARNAIPIQCLSTVQAAVQSGRLPEYQAEQIRQRQDRRDAEAVLYFQAAVVARLTGQAWPLADPARVEACRVEAQAARLLCGPGDPPAPPPADSEVEPGMEGPTVPWRQEFAAHLAAMAPGIEVRLAFPDPDDALQIAAGLGLAERAGLAPEAIADWFREPTRPCFTCQRADLPGAILLGQPECGHTMRDRDWRALSGTYWNTPQPAPAPTATPPPAPSPEVIGPADKQALGIAGLQFRIKQLPPGTRERARLGDELAALYLAAGKLGTPGKRTRR